MRDPRDENIHAKKCALVLLPEIFGVNHNIRETADRFAESRMIVLAPDMFWRFGPNIELAYTGADLEQALQYQKAFDLKTGLQDVASAVTFIRHHPRCSGKVVMLGFGLGGTLTYLAATEVPISLRAAVTFYGTGIARNLDRVIDLLCPLQMHFAERDPDIPFEDLKKISNAFSIKRDIDFLGYEHTAHGFYNRERPEYVASAANLAHDHATNFVSHHSNILYEDY